MYQGGKYMLSQKEIKEYMKQYNIDNKREIAEQKKQYYIDNKEHKKEYMKQYRKDFPEHHKRYYENNREEINRYHTKYCKHKRKTDLKFNLSRKISNAIRLALKNNKAGRHWEDLVGYSLGDLIKRLKKTMPYGHAWQDVLNGSLHVDHIIPKSAFNYTKPEHFDFKECWALSNLRLLSAKENRIKSNELCKPFQPALNI